MSAWWRVFPWDGKAKEGVLFSRSHVPPATGRGRFDLPVDHSRVLYVSESPEHAVAELLQPWRNRRLRPEHLVRGGRPLALVSVELRLAAGGRPLDLCDPGALLELETRPDRVASRDRGRTQGIALDAWRAGATGLRWWSVFHGDWHGVAVFIDRVGDALDFGEPEVLTLDSVPLRLAAAALGMTI